MERQYLGFQRRVTSAVDEKVAKGSAALDKWKRDAGAYMDEFKRKGEKEREAMDRDLSSVRRIHRMQLDFHDRQIDRMWKKLVKIEKQCAKSSN